MDKETRMSFWIPGNTPSSKNGRGVFNGYVIPSAATSKWIRRTKDYWKDQKEDFLKVLSEVEPPYYIEFTFIRRTRHRFDYNNISQAPLDQMKKHGWIPDDNADIIKPYYGDYRYDKHNPGLIIRILRNKPNHYGNIQTQS